MQEITRVIVGIQCFAVGLELPKHYFKRHWKSVLYLLGPVMSFSWAITSLFAYFIFQTTVPTALIIGACLSPTDPILAASVLSKSQFSERVPPRIRHLLSAESACNDGVSFPFLYIGLVIFTTHGGPGEAIKEWQIDFFDSQILANTYLDLVLWYSTFFLPCFLLALDLFWVRMIFLVAFGAGVGFAHDGWFSKKTKTVAFPVIVDHLLNSTMFAYFGSIIPWNQFQPTTITPHIKPWTLILFLILVLLFRRIPILLLTKPFIPDICTYREALFAGHFGPMGVGALFLAIEARAQLETGTSLPLPRPIFPDEPGPISEETKAIWIIWPVICFVVFGSTMVHGLSVMGISLGGHFLRKEGERAPLLGETRGLSGMVHEGGGGESEPEVSGSEAE
ncbi:uncharacterized protein EAF02_003015 [Botrytis sinoallii]|uniref:uncharacterized protein n=1 Tax=Botrytis sinoallii TaxID=1463999 RepID=UPI00190252CB|nr:uncharacterized protein EAF02_003015 [Botrytis sinoallii]KAF7888474.1 hypothetical protein EAF02_003015 [Botrytis sinoallii]